MIQLLVNLSRLIDFALTAWLTARRKAHEEELRVAIAEAKVARTVEERREAARKINAHFTSR